VTVGLGDSYLLNGAKAATPIVGEQILHVTFGSRVGSMGAVLMGQLSGIGGMAPRDAIHRPGGKDSKLPMNFMIVITPSRVWVFKHKMFWGRIKIKDTLGVFERVGMQAFVGDGTVRQFSLVQQNPPQAMSFEITVLGKRAAEMVQEMTYLLTTPPGYAPQAPQAPQAPPTTMF
jgi:hypothetical protein